MNAGVAPSWLRMNVSAISSRSTCARRPSPRAQLRDGRAQNPPALRHDLDLTRRLQLNHFPSAFITILVISSMSPSALLAPRASVVHPAASPFDFRRAGSYHSTTGAVCSRRHACACGSPPARRPCGARAFRRTSRTRCPARAPCTASGTRRTWYARSAGARARRRPPRRAARRPPCVPARSSTRSSPSACGTVRTTPSSITPFARWAWRAPPS